MHWHLARTIRTNRLSGAMMLPTSHGRLATGFRAESTASRRALEGT